MTNRITSVAALRNYMLGRLWNGNPIFTEPSRARRVTFLENDGWPLSVGDVREQDGYCVVDAGVSLWELRVALKYDHD